MARRSLLIFLILLGTLQTVYCGNDWKKPRFSKKTELKNSDLTEQKAFSFENNEPPSEKKVIEKRRLLFNEGELNAPATTVRDLENSDFSTRRQTNYTVTETDIQIPEYQRGFNKWENKKNSFLFPKESGSSRNPPDFRLRQPLLGQTNSNQNLNWNQNTNIFGTEESHWNEGKNIKQIASSESNSRTDNGYDGRVAQMIGNTDANHNFYPNEKAELLNRRVSMTTLNEEAMLSPQRKENIEMVHAMKPEYLSHSSMNYYNRNPASFWNPNLYRPEKGVIINFNTECPAPRLLNNQMVHKFIFTPKPSVSTLSDCSSFQIPQTAFISTHKKPPVYYV